MKRRIALLFSAALAWGSICACGRAQTPEKAEKPDSSPPSSDATPSAIDVFRPPAATAAPAVDPKTESISPACKRALEEAQKERPFEPADKPLDLNADGTPDCLFKICIGANCSVRAYVVEKSGARLVAEVTSSFISTPHCVSPIKPHTFCTLSVSEHMIHGELQESFFEYADGQYTKGARGRMIPGPKLR